jgi:hypothetical protein
VNQLAAPVAQTRETIRLAKSAQLSSTSPVPPLVFISHATEDLHFVLHLAESLAARQIDSFVAARDLPTGNHWDQELAAKIESSTAVIVVLSPEAAASVHVADEIGWALSHERRVIPIILRACTPPYRIHRVHFLRFHDQPFDKALDSLVGALARPEVVASEEDSSVASRPSALPWRIAGVIAALVLASLAIAATKWLRTTSDLVVASTQSSSEPAAPARVPPQSPIADVASPADPLSSLPSDAPVPPPSPPKITNPRTPRRSLRCDVCNVAGYPSAQGYPGRTLISDLAPVNCDKECEACRLYECGSRRRP